MLYTPDVGLTGHYRAVQAPPLGDPQETTADEYKVLDTPVGKIGILLCYEDTTPKLAREAVAEGAEIIIALSNPGHFTKTHLPRHHLFQDQLRAIESGRFVARVSASGYSALIDPRGRLLNKSKLDHEEILQVIAGLIVD